MAPESADERQKRLHQRELFDTVAELYDASRRGYSSEIVDFVVATAGVHQDSQVLEVGCGTGQLTEALVQCGLAPMAIDIGPSMIAFARRRLGASTASFQETSFEDFQATEASFDLVVSATAWHWIDPAVRFEKAARLLRPGGWLALLSTGEKYDDPFGSKLLEMWVDRSDDGGAWAKQRKLPGTGIDTSTGLFETPIQKVRSEPMALPVETVIGVENTRATSLSWPADVRHRFTEELREHLRAQTEVSLTQVTSVTMARALPKPVRG